MRPSEDGKWNHHSLDSDIKSLILKESWPQNLVLKFMKIKKVSSVVVSPILLIYMSNFPLSILHMYGPTDHLRDICAGGDKICILIFLKSILQYFVQYFVITCSSHNFSYFLLGLVLE